MKDESLMISEQTFNPPADTNLDIELLARETGMPRELVAKLYTSECAKLERTARIKTYVPVLIHRHVKALLREQHRAQEIVVRRMTGGMAARIENPATI
jgi:Protein of unknown function (DUF3562)